MYGSCATSVNFGLFDCYMFCLWISIWLCTVWMSKCFLFQTNCFTFYCSFLTMWQANSLPVIHNAFHSNSIGLMSRVFANGLGDQGLIPGRVILKTQKMVLDPTLFNTQHYKVKIKSKVEQSREWSSTLPYISIDR